MIFKAIAILEMAVFYGCYFSKMISQRKQGIQTDQMGKGKVGFVKFIEIALKMVAFLVPMVELISIFLIAPKFPIGVQWCGALVGLLGVVVFALAIATMKDNWRAGVSETDKTQLVTHGIYQISRNPAFLGFNLLYIGILLMFFNLILFAVTLLAMVLFHLQIVNVEEDFLIAEFGQDYINYRSKVGRYIGRRK